MNKITAPLIVVGLVALIVLGANGMMSEFTSNHGNPTTDLSGISQADELNEKANAIRETYNTKIREGTIIDLPFAVVKGFLEVVDLVATAAFGFMDTLFTSLVSLIIGLPTWAIVLGTTLIIIMILSALLSNTGGKQT